MDQVGCRHSTCLILAMGLKAEGLVACGVAIGEKDEMWARMVLRGVVEQRSQCSGTSPEAAPIGRRASKRRGAKCLHIFGARGRAESGYILFVSNILSLRASTHGGAESLFRVIGADGRKEYRFMDLYDAAATTSRKLWAEGALERQRR